MSQQFSNGHNPTGYPFFHQPTPAQTYDNRSHGQAQTRPSSPNTLPPLPASIHPSTDANDIYRDRNTLQHLLTPTSSGASYPAYAPTANRNICNGLPVSQASYGCSYAQGPGPRIETVQTQIPQCALPPFTAAPSSTYTSASSMAYTSAPSAPPRALQEIAPMPSRHNGLTPITSRNTLLPQPDDQTQHRHVVGQQGRRGVLPSAPGRASVNVVSGANMDGVGEIKKAEFVPEKNEDGKYPCPCCHKIYLHAKHLKRHFLRRKSLPSIWHGSSINYILDTGHRPYTCGLCMDNFSRSDILKRHFSKCSDRRGNPSGQSHLMHSRMHSNSNSRIKQEQEDSSRTPSSTPTISPSDETAYHEPEHIGLQDLHIENFNTRQYGSAHSRFPHASSIQTSTAENGGQSLQAQSLAQAPWRGTGYEPSSYAHNPGTVTPDSVESSSGVATPFSGVATPFTYPHESPRNPLSSHEPFPSVSNGDMSFAASSRAHTSSNYGSAHLPRIADNGQGRGNDSDWSQYHYLQNHDYSNQPSGYNTPLHRIHKPLDFSLIQQQYPYLHNDDNNPPSH